ncbi:poly-beta-1,6-N-acetyl-D-glucosamine biosynthesis protein PgaD [Pseudomonas sp. TKO26]|uniref:poly-beta-1,6-N-acetyl-D-glucosamine biosynthesis protein PgaD n=1 Tax=unclassified Pseudomonas TaxID=196821 RepID=UPI000D8AF5A4|nr:MULTISPECIES: poly-beta-1,6-N-acetyl-D-glucosamine biosynthesis protein PgaD [unclassified Pseudomonas]PYY89539.1 poly-beta-1,6-N-acetyl-D-glucosamine biosynthesis protein PgaD [Pseudomonas sp. TKO30]PYY92626.1 poly-beta-1,6-N-acetyl-D-glucosamine biosynthesis protein PgaD [Pseudomonas sp. TKO29]PYY94990.1 poly-beta-1,6-N-acetyl-D-glucosamine biosynthesis protein PgaD [Pseudomonas sp. TKO26]PYZ01076.1 poly-beta-1,6-N-acetyl-D-glucosamine biosynthesis protein PgaD [Pseudomonas sp. TKO14]
MKIIRTRQRPFMLVVDIILTVLAWVGLLYLLIRGLIPLLDKHEGPRIEVGMLDALTTLQFYGLVAVINALLLVSWARYRQRRNRNYPPRLPAPVVDDKRLSESFKLSDETFTQMRQPGVITVYNDEEGGIMHVATQFYRIRPEDQQHPPLVVERPPRVIHLHSEEGEK